MKKNLFSQQNGIRRLFLALIIVSGYLVSSILSIKSDHGVNQQDGMYWQPKNTINAVMMGTSHVHCGINTGLLWEKYGIASYDYSGAEQPLWMTYFFLKELYKYQSPEVVVVDMYAPARFKEDYQYDWIAQNIYGMKFSLNKMQMLAVSVEPRRMHEYFPAFAVYHSRYDSLEKEDFENFFWNSQQKEAFKGYTPYWNKEKQNCPQIQTKVSGGLTHKSEVYLRKIINLTRKKGSRLILITVPYIFTEEDQQTYNQIKEISEEEGVPFINYNEYYEKMGLNFEEDFNDFSHLNYWGSCKFTDYFGSYLSSEQGLPDQRGEAGYESWDDNVEMIQKELKSHLKK